MKYEVCPRNRYKPSLKDAYIDAKSPLDALKIYLKNNNIFYVRIDKMTNRYIKEHFGNLTPLEVVDKPDFVVNNYDDPMGGGMYILKEGES